MRVLIIGGTHFIGPAVVAELQRSMHEITVYHRGQHEPHLPSDVRHVHSPAAGIPVLHFPPDLSEPRPEVVLHMFPVGDDDARAVMAHFDGVARRIVALSSGDVYRAYGRLLGAEPGPPELVPLNEEARLRTKLFPYRQAAGGPSEWTFHYEKLLVERAVLGTRSLPGTVLRLPAVYGPGDPYRRFRPFIKRMQDRRPAILLEETQAVWRWTHGYVKDVARAIALAVNDDRAAGKIYNVGEAETPMVSERVRRIGTVAGWTGSVVPIEADRLPAHLRAPYQPDQDLVVDSRKIREELGYQELHSPDEAIRQTVEWELANPPGMGDPGALEYAAEDFALHQGLGT
jgi:nucleoside-diphosphate-sugar epimerase